MTAAPFDAALFDLDGTLVETERLLYKAWIELARRAGVDFRTFDYADIIGRPDVDCCRIVSEHYGLGRDPSAWHEEYKDILLDLMARDLELRPGAEEVLGRIDDIGVPMAVVTSGTSGHARRCLAKFGLFGRFKVIVTADTPGLAARKPDPAPYRLAADLLGVRASRCVAFEDSPAGVRSAVDAGCLVFAVPHEHSPMAHLRDAHAVLASLGDFRPGTVHLL